MMKVAVLIGCLLYCSGCGFGVPESKKNRAEAVMADVYPEDWSVFASVYGESNEDNILKKSPKGTKYRYRAPLK